MLWGNGMQNILADYERLERTAHLLKVLAHPVRLCIVAGLLRTGECNVNKIQTCLDLPQSTVSQHLARLREAGVVVATRVGVEVFYHVAEGEMTGLIRSLLPSSGDSTSVGA